MSKTTPRISTPASWVEVSDTYVKLEFQCEKCGRRYKKSVADFIMNAGSDSIPIPTCNHCKIVMKKYIGTYVYQ